MAVVIMLGGRGIIPAVCSIDLSEGSLSFWQDLAVQLRSTYK